MSDVEHTHVVDESVTITILTPGHAPRTASAAYHHTHHQLIYELDKPCAWCGVRRSVLLPAGIAGTRSPQNPRGATQMESHHFPVEWSWVDALDWRKIHRDFPEVVSQQTLLAWIDSPRNMLILCDICHRGPQGIHHLSASDASLQPYLLDGYVFEVDKAHIHDANWLATVEAEDDALSKAESVATSPAVPAVTPAAPSPNGAAQ